MFFLGNAEGFTIHSDIETEITIGVLSSLLSQNSFTSSDLLITSLTSWIWMICKNKIILIIDISLSLLLGNIVSLTIHMDIQTEISLSWIFVLLLIILFFLGNAERLTSHVNIETKITIWILSCLLSQNSFTSSDLLITGLTCWIWMISELSAFIQLHKGVILLAWATKTSMSCVVLVTVVIWND